MATWRGTLVVVFVLVGGPALGATRTWSGAGLDAKWSTPANWVEGQAPGPGDDLVFPAGALQKTTLNDLPPGTAVGSLTFSCSSGDCVVSAGGYTLTGNAIALRGDIVMERGADNTIQLDVVLPLDLPQSLHRVTVTSIAARLRLAGIVAGGPFATLAKHGPGTLRLAGLNAYEGPTRVEAGLLEVATPLGLGFPTRGTVAASGATLALDGASGPLVIDEPLDLSGGGANDSGALANLAGSNTLTGAMTLSETAVVAVGTTSVAANALTLTGPISGPGGLTKSGPNPLVMGGTAVNTFLGPMTVLDGVLRLARVAPGVSIPQALVVGGATEPSNHLVTARLEQEGHPQLAPDVAVTIGSDGYLDLNGFSLGVGSLTVGWGGRIETGSGQLVLHGPVSGNGGRIYGHLSLGGATRVVNGVSVFADIVDGGAPAGVTVTAGGLQLNLANTYSGPTTVLGGELSFYHPLALGSSSGGTTVAAGASLGFKNGVVDEPLFLSGALIGEGVWAGDVTIAGSATIRSRRALEGGSTALDTALELRGRVGGTGTVEVGICLGGMINPQPPVRLTGAWEFAGPVVVRAGKLIIGAQAAALNPSNSVTLTQCDPTRWGVGVLDLNGFDATIGPLSAEDSAGVLLGSRNDTVFTVVVPDGQSSSFRGSISGRGHVHKAGAGTWTLTGTNAASGLTVVREGTLVVHGSQVSGTVIVESGAILQGDGHVGYLEVDGILKPIGRLQAADLVMTGGSTLVVDSAVATVGVTGGVNLTGSTLQVSSFAFPAELLMIDNDGTDPVIGTFAGLPEGGQLKVGRTTLRVSYVGGTGNDVILSRLDATLTVAKTGTGAGSVVSTTPAGVIDCGATCSASVPLRTAVTLQATAGAHAIFTGWSGASCSGTETCTITVTDDTSVTAGFESTSGYLAEGATSSFFDTRLAVLNPSATATVTGTVTFQRSDGTTVTQALSVPPRRRQTLDVKSVPGMAAAEFSTLVEADRPLVVDRTMTWDADAYGAHAETAVAAPALTWSLAEGATHSGFHLFYLLQNPNATAAEVRVRYLRHSGEPLEKTYVLPPTSRTNIWVNREEFAGVGQALASTDVSAVVEGLNAQPIIVERAMYLDVPGQPFAAGHESAGVTAPATAWFLAEGATGPFFDLFVLIANPGTADAEVEATYLRSDGRTVTKRYTVPATRRFTIWVNLEDAQLADTAVSTTFRSTNGVPVIVERAMWWPGGGWVEAHNSPGATTTGTVWAVAEGEVNVTRNLETYLLIANTSATAADVKVTLLFEDGTSAERTFAGIAAKSRFNVPAGHDFPEAAGKRFGAIVESLGTTPAPIVVERAMYWDALGQTWAAGTNALATKLQ